MLASLQRQLCLRLACRAFQSQHDFLRGLGLLVEDRLGLSTVAGLLAIITALSLCEERCLVLVLENKTLALRGFDVPFRLCIALLCVGCVSGSLCLCSRCVWSWGR